MAKFSRGGQLSDPGRKMESEQRKLRLSQKRKLEKRQKFKQFAKKGLLIAVLLLIGALIVSQQTVKIASSSENQNYTDSANEYIADNPLRMSKLFLDTEELKNYIIEKNPEVGNVRVNMPLIGHVTVETTQRSPAFYWLNASSTYIGDETGVIYTKAGQENSLNIPKLRDNSPLEPQIGDRLASSSTLEYIDALKNELESKSIAVSEYQIPASTREINVFLEGKKYYVKVSQDRSVVGQVDELDKTIKFLESNNRKVKDYIDVRVIDKAYYR